MKKVISLIVVIIFIGAVAIAGYYWYKKQNDPPKLKEYENIEELNKDIARLEPIYNAGRLSWQEKYLLGVAYLQNRRLADAAKIFEEVTKLHPNYYRTYESLGMAYYMMDETEKAVSIWEKTIKMSSQAAHLEDMINRGKQKLEFGKRISVLEKEVKDNNSMWQNKYELAILYIGVNRFNDAARLLEQVVTVKKDSPDIYDAIAQAYAMINNFEKAVISEKNAVALKPSEEKYKKRLAEMEKIYEGIKRGEYHKQ